MAYNTFYLSKMTSNLFKYVPLYSKNQQLNQSHSYLIQHGTHTHQDQGIQNIKAFYPFNVKLEAGTLFFTFYIAFDVHAK